MIKPNITITIIEQTLVQQISCIALFLIVYLIHPTTLHNILTIHNINLSFVVTMSVFMDHNGYDINNFALLRKLNAQHKMVFCRYCKGDHRSTCSKCPYKDTLGATSKNLHEVNQIENGSCVLTRSGTMAIGGGGGSICLIQNLFLFR